MRVLKPHNAIMTNAVGAAGSLSMVRDPILHRTPTVGDGAAGVLASRRSPRPPLYRLWREDRHLDALLWCAPGGDAVVAAVRRTHGLDGPDGN